MTLKVSYIVAMKELPPIPTPTVVPETPAPLDEVSARVLAQRIAPEAVRQLYNIGCDPEAKAAARVSALGKIVDLAEGKEQNEGNYTIIINQINRALGLKDVTPQDS